MKESTAFRKSLFKYWSTDRFINLSDTDTFTFSDDIVLKKALCNCYNIVDPLAYDYIMNTAHETMCLLAYKLLLEKAATFLKDKTKFNSLEFCTMYALTEHLFKETGNPTPIETAVERFLADRIWETHLKQVVPIANQELSISTTENDEEQLFRRLLDGTDDNDN